MEINLKQAMFALLFVLYQTLSLNTHTHTHTYISHITHRTHITENQTVPVETLIAGHDSIAFPPVDVKVELVIAVVLILVGVVLPLQIEPILVSKNTKMKGMEETMGRIDFAVFNHRGSQGFSQRK